MARSLSDVGLPHPILVDIARQSIADNEPDMARVRANSFAQSLLRPVINATGVLLHTNLGRSPIGVNRSPRYTNLEFDLTTGRRGSRGAHTARLMSMVTGAEAALIVNNGASALLLVLTALATDRQVIVSRGELVEIGGGFRLPEVMAASGARLVEVGTTNKTNLNDYKNAINDDTAVVLKVHQSNYSIIGYTSSVDVRELSGLGPPIVFDIGSGLLDASTPWLADGPPPWLSGEPAARQSLEQGAALVTFSADKLMGGPQAGIIAGNAELVSRCAALPIYRALRPGELVLSALQQTALAYLRHDGTAIPFWDLATRTVAELSERAEALGIGKIVKCSSLVGGGSAPAFQIPSVGVAIDGDITAELRDTSPPIIARVRHGQTVADLRTVDPSDDSTLAKALQSIGGGGGQCVSS